MIRPYYKDDAVTIYNCDCREIINELGSFDLLLCDPPYGIGLANGMGGGGVAGICPRNPKSYTGSWDKEKPNHISDYISMCAKSIIWGGNFFSDQVPQGDKWLVWDKEMTMPSYSDCELAWTNLDGCSLKMFRYCGNGLMAKEKERFHPTQKPVALMQWCISLTPQVTTILDPFAGSGTTGRAAKNMNKTAVLIEREERYCEISAQRMQQEVLQF